MRTTNCGRRQAETTKSSYEDKKSNVTATSEKWTVSSRIPFLLPSSRTELDVHEHNPQQRRGEVHRSRSVHREETTKRKSLTPELRMKMKLQKHQESRNHREQIGQIAMTWEADLERRKIEAKTVIYARISRTEQ
ncbi:hypothetical protein SAY87_008170 [Trapa incisa]|uniref:Uncharacterized protein n=1 Tax=Trapa incisa TaxID=236973 RepID=A0AAN7KCT1_9MYRT|nr:hypothetical protein SAY87_008170 [Trapa incisa]